VLDKDFNLDRDDSSEQSPEAKTVAADSAAGPRDQSYLACKVHPTNPPNRKLIESRDVGVVTPANPEIHAKLLGR